MTAEPRDVPAEHPPCEHHWISSHQPDFPDAVYWIDTCSACGDINGARLAEEVAPLLDRLAAADRENAELRERLGTERLVHALQEQRLATSMSFRGAPRWDEDRVVIEHDWLDGHCGRCGEAIPQPAENAELRGEVERLEARIVRADEARRRIERDRDEARSERDDAGLLWGRHYNDAMGALETQLAAAQAQLAEVQRAVGYLLLCHDTSSAQASDWLSAWRTAGAVMARATGYDGPALSAAPQPEPESPCAVQDAEDLSPTGLNDQARATPASVSNATERSTEMNDDREALVRAILETPLTPAWREAVRERAASRQPGEVITIMREWCAAIVLGAQPEPPASAEPTGRSD